MQILQGMSSRVYLMMVHIPKFVLIGRKVAEQIFKQTLTHLLVLEIGYQQRRPETVFFCVPDVRLADAIHPTFVQALRAKYFATAPAMPKGSCSINFTTTNPATFAHFCCVKCCPHYNNGFQTFCNGDNGYQEASHNVREFHWDYHHNLQEDELEVIE